MTISTATPAAAAPLLELRPPVDVAEPPLGYDDLGGHLAIEVALAGGGYTTLILAADGARAWAGELFGAVTVAHREAVGDPHALDDLDLADLPDPDGYDPAVTLSLTGTPDCPARMRFTITVTIGGQHLDDARLRAALVECLTSRFPAATVAVSDGQHIAGTRSTQER